MKQNIFIHNRVFVSFSPVHVNAFPFENAYVLMRFRLSSTLKRPETQIKTTVCDYVTVMKRLRFHLFPGVLEDRRKRTKMYSFSNENAVWMAFRDAVEEPGEMLTCRVNL